MLDFVLDLDAPCDGLEEEVGLDDAVGLADPPEVNADEALFLALAPGFLAEDIFRSWKFS